MMNERIRELAKDHIVYERFTQCGESIDEVYYEFYPEELQEFVELIVQECADITHSLIMEDGKEFPMKSVAHRLKQHFGVEL